MTLSDWGLYLSFVLASTLTPGPAVLLAISNGATLGKRAAALSSLGNIAGLTVLSLAAMIGVGGVVLASKPTYTFLQVAGAAYLVYLGAKKWMANHVSAEAVKPGNGMRGNLSVFSQGMLVALSNPKAILFFMALLPQFIAPGKPLLPQFATLTAVLLLFSFTALMGYAVIAEAGRSRSLDHRRVSIFNRVVAIVFIALGILLMLAALSSVQ